MPYKKDMVGQKRGKLTIIKYSHNQNNSSRWLAKCDCGEHIVVDIRNFNSGSSTSCGCNRRGHRNQNISHPIHKVWIGLRNRCKNQNYDSYHRYGGRGIKVCKRWDNYQLFYDDVIDGYVSGLQLDRIDNDGNYEPSNVRWVSREIQMQNSSKAKLNSDQVINIRMSKESRSVLANRYGVSVCTIHDIRTYRSWKNIKVV